MHAHMSVTDEGSKKVRNVDTSQSFAYNQTPISLKTFQRNVPIAVVT
jgi:hypothetical protein